MEMRLKGNLVVVRNYLDYSHFILKHFF